MFVFFFFILLLGYSYTYAQDSNSHVEAEVQTEDKAETDIKTDEDGQTNLEGVFAGGDIVTGSATVISAMGAGKSAAKAIDAYLTNKYLNK